MSDQKKKQYTKHSSNYIKTTPHQTLSDGSTIFERDWVTIGSQLSFGPNKTPYFNDGNFIFTTSILPTYQKKPKLGTKVGVYTYEDLTYDDTYVGSDETLINCCDMRTYAYYGSCVELLRTSIEHIIRTFPPSITTDNTTQIQIDGINLGFLVQNPFLVDLLGVYNTVPDIDELRILPKSHKNYTINDSDVSSYSISQNIVNKTNLYDCENEFVNNGHKPVFTISINGYTIACYLIEGELVFYSKSDVTIRPKKNILTKYFRSLNGFEAVLLNQNSTPKYTNDFITPLEVSNGYNFFKRRYTWPSFEGNIDIHSNTYATYLNGLMNIAQTFDELSSNVIWNKLTHESIKNYDWDKSHNNEYISDVNGVPNEERMHKVINVIGATFDKIKARIDITKKKNYISYDNSYIAPTQTIIERLELHGWDVKSLLLIDKSEETSKNNTNKEEAYELKKDIYRNENEMFKRLLLSSKRILQTKGTTNAIKMVFAFFGYGDEAFKISEEYYITKPEKYEESDDDVFALNRRKYIEYDRFEPLAGIPVGIISKYNKTSTTLEDEKYLIPYFHKNKTYDGNLYFQSKGGWCYNTLNKSYIETIPYLHTASTIEDLLQINPNIVNKKDIYYVVNISDISTYNDEGSLDKHFFVLEDDFNPNIFKSWKQFGIDEASIKDAGSDAFIMEAITKAKYLDGIVPTNKGNNPHCGFGFYDNGKTYREYLEKPFKYAIDKKRFSEADSEKADQFKFEIETHSTIDGALSANKVVIIDKQKQTEKPYYLNSKVVKIVNLINNKTYVEYFYNVILSYLTQVIPTTTILILENFKYDKDTNDK